ncbi:uncharacterized protein CcaverHIS019_0602450 [Cutaneotrichosporon cavernicola]|uniref:WD40 repeat-like protein n=1 Tax=Cutaneotrichosporon cavernicola TaxID=279322 RepID=A0AA48L7Z9_9TREE|nr:uncharacterized protein CcaverHIS019_0602450 [Cutaneotrichosporon cavernicola]BEI93786.1 hypothetical protein CcaverHIS019_0602450 [Cutaneotrichosporon cavernicola]
MPQVNGSSTPRTGIPTPKGSRLRPQVAVGTPTPLRVPAPVTPVTPDTPSRPAASRVVRSSRPSLTTRPSPPASFPSTVSPTTKLERPPSRTSTPKRVASPARSVARKKSITQLQEPTPPLPSAAPASQPYAPPALSHQSTPPTPPLPTPVVEPPPKPPRNARRADPHAQPPELQTSELDVLKARLESLQTQYRVLQTEHARCAPRVARVPNLPAGVSADKVLELLYDRATLGAIVHAMPREQRTSLLGVMAEACRPSDIQAQIDVLEQLKECRSGVLGRMDDKLVTCAIQFLPRGDILNLRLVSKRYDRLASLPAVWRPMCKELEATWDGTIDLSNYGLEEDGDCGSYDDTIRIWHLPYAVTSAKAVPPPQVIPAKSVSSLDYYAPEQVLVTGSHDVGRATLWRQIDGEWKADRILSGHLHGTRAVAINAQWMISVGSDKAIVVWDWRSGSKVVRFGQQTNVCIGMNLLDNFIITATVDGVIRSFSIQKREMLGSFKLSDLAARQPEYASKLKDVGVGALGMLTWFEAEGRFMACATKDIVIRLAWDWATSEEQQEMEDGVPSSLSPSKDASVAPLRPRLSAGVAGSPRPQSPAAPRRAAASPVHKATATATATGSKLIDTLTNVSDDVAATSGTASKYAFMRPPRIVEILDITGTERGAFEAGRVRIITSRRLSVKAGAERRVIVGTERLGENGDPTMKLVSLGGKWDTQGREAGLHIAAKNPMSLALDHDKLVYGCTDGSIVVAGFVGADGVVKPNSNPMPSKPAPRKSNKRSP